MDIPPFLPTVAPSPLVGIGSSATPFDYSSVFQNLCERLDRISFDIQQMRLNQQEDMCTFTGDFHAYREAQDRHFQELMAQ